MKKILLIGLGRMGRNHAEAIKKLNLKIFAACDINTKTLNDFSLKNNFPISKCFNDVKKMMEYSKDSDLIIIATTADKHLSIIKICAKFRPKKILCEKPMAQSIYECKQIIELLNKFKIKFGINHQMRKMPQYTEIRKFIDLNLLGKLSSMNVSGGCFGLSNNGSHYLEAFKYLTDSKIKKCSGFITDKPIKNPRGKDLYDFSGNFTYVNKKNNILNINATYKQGHGMTVTYLFEFGHIFSDEFAGELIVTHRKKKFFNEPSIRYGLPWKRFVKKIEPADNIKPTMKIIKSLLEGKDYPDQNSGLEITKSLVASIISSSENSRFVSMNFTSKQEKKKYFWG